MKNLTVFTPTFNRAHLLPRLYESLLRQTDKNFIWMIVDDGSEDGTKELAEKWQRENRIDIQYFFKKNEGMHSGHNKAYSEISTPYNVCIDSDDYMPDDAVDIINRYIKEIGSDDDCCGIVGLDADESGKIIGTKIPEHLEKVKLSELYQKHGVSGDKKLVYKTKHIKSVPEYPIFLGEKFVPLDYKYLLLDQKYWLKPINEILAIVEYQTDGSTRNMLKQYRRHPKGFAFSRISRINLAATEKERVKNAIHLVSCTLFTKDFGLLFQTKHTASVVAMLPFGILLNLYIRLKTKKNP